MGSTSAAHEKLHPARCARCGCRIDIDVDAISDVLALVAGMCHQQGIEMLSDGEIGMCLPCWRIHREDFNAEVYLAELRATEKDIRNGIVVPEEQMQRVLAGPFGWNLREFLEARRQVSRRDPPARAERKAKTKREPAKTYHDREPGEDG